MRLSCSTIFPPGLAEFPQHVTQTRLERARPGYCPWDAYPFCLVPEPPLIATVRYSQRSIRLQSSPDMAGHVLQSTSRLYSGLCQSSLIKLSPGPLPRQTPCHIPRGRGQFELPDRPSTSESCHTQSTWTDTGATCLRSVQRDRTLPARTSLTYDGHRKSGHAYRRATKRGAALPSDQSNPSRSVPGTNSRGALYRTHSTSTARCTREAS